jgi:hypothetical protein
MSASTPPLPSAVLRSRQVRPGVAVFAAACGVIIAVGALLPWLGADGARPAMGMRHTSLSQMLVYTVRESSMGSSVAFAVLVLGALIVIGALTGLRIMVGTAALLALAAGGMWIGLIEHHYNTPELPNIHYVNPANLPWSGLRLGAWLTIAAAVLALLSAFALRQPTGAPHAA